MAQIKTVAQAAKRIEELEARCAGMDEAFLSAAKMDALKAEAEIRLVQNFQDRLDKLEEAAKIANIAARLQGEMNWMPRK